MTTLQAGQNWCQQLYSCPIQLLLHDCIGDIAFQGSASCPICAVAAPEAQSLRTWSTASQSTLRMWQAHSLDSQRRNFWRGNVLEMCMQQVQSKWTGHGFATRMTSPLSVERLRVCHCSQRTKLLHLMRQLLCFQHQMRYNFCCST